MKFSKLIDHCISNSCTHLSAACIVSVFLLAVLSGCDDGRPKRVKVAGQVTVAGKLLKHGSIAFLPQDGGRPGGAGLENGGKYSVTMYELNDGLPPGTYKVSVNSVQGINEKSERWHAPKKYADFETSGLIAEISEATDAMNFDLSWEGDEHDGPWVESF